MLSAYCDQLQGGTEHTCSLSGRHQADGGVTIPQQISTGRADQHPHDAQQTGCCALQPSQQIASSANPPQ